MAEKSTIARPYAQAIFAIAREQGNLQDWSGMLQLAAEVAADPTMAKVIDNPRVTRNQVCELFLEICGDGLNDTAKNMIGVLADNGRLGFMPEIAALFEVERAHAEGFLNAEVVSAFPLTEAQKGSIAEALKRRLGKNINLECKTDESLLGGAVIRAGNLVIDGSAVGKLETLAANLLH